MASTQTASVRKTRAAGLSVLSNSALIILKLIAGLLTGSVAILSDAIQSTMDLVASSITLFSVRKAEQPPDPSHRFGHEKVEDLSAAIEAMLLLVGATVIAYQAVRRLINGGSVGELGIGIAVVAVAAVVNILVAAYLARVARETGSSALEADGAHLRTDAIVSVGVLVALITTQVTGAQWIDPVVGLLVAGVISVTGLRILVGSGRRLIDESLPADEMAALEEVVQTFVHDKVAGFHDLRARHSGASHQVDLHLQFRAGTSLEEAHRISHQLQDAVIERLPGTTVLVHLEPEDRVRPDTFDTDIISGRAP
jgi:cation diffusion facilitator family transporter